MNFNVNIELAIKRNIEFDLFTLCPQNRYNNMVDYVNIWSITVNWLLNFPLKFCTKPACRLGPMSSICSMNVGVKNKPFHSFSNFLVTWLFVIEQLNFCWICTIITSFHTDNDWFKFLECTFLFSKFPWFAVCKLK